MARDLDCIVIGYNELPFAQYEKLLRGYNEDSEAYRDFRLSFVQAEGHKLPYADLMNHAVFRSQNGSGPEEPEAIFKSGDIPNLAAAYLTNFLNERGYPSRYINLFQHEKERLAEMLTEGPLCVAITTTFYVLNFPVVDMVEHIRTIAPEVKIIVGGPLVANHERNYTPEQLETALGEIGADVYVVESQGELTLSRIVECLKSDGDLAEVPNIYYAADGGLLKTKTEPEVNSLDENFIDWANLADGKNLGPTLQTRTARSCAFSCAFCNYPTRAGKLTLLGLDRLEQELDSMQSLGYVKNVVFIDDTFNVPIRRFKDLCRLLIKKKYGFKWYSYFRCSNSDDEAIELAAESGCEGVFLGIESGSPTILKNMNKKAEIDQYYRGVEKLRQEGVLTFGSFITGFPGETQQTVDETKEFISTAGLDYYRTQLWYCEEGTPIQQRREEFDIQGHGFIWKHKTMDSAEAMDAIEETFLEVEDVTWLPQWSFDFWIIPYLLGLGVELDDFKTFMQGAQKLLTMAVDPVPDWQRGELEKKTLNEMFEVAKGWQHLRG